MTALSTCDKLYKNTVIHVCFDNDFFLTDMPLTYRLALKDIDNRVYTVS